MAETDDKYKYFLLTNDIRVTNNNKTKGLISLSK